MLIKKLKLIKLDFMVCKSAAKLLLFPQINEFLSAYFSLLLNNVLPDLSMGRGLNRRLSDRVLKG